MKKLIALLVISMLMLSLVGCGQKTEETSDNAGKDVQKTQKVLKLGHFSPEGHPYFEGMSYFAQRVEELTNGSVKVEVYPAEQAGKLDDLFDLTKSGTLDMGYTSTAAMAGTCPINTVVMMPLWTTAAEGQAVTMKMVEKVPELSEEYTSKGVRIVFAFSTDMYNIGTTKKPVHVPDDVKGMKLVSAGGLTGKIPALYGITPVVMGVGDYYDALQKGIVEGAVQPINTIKSYRLYENMKYQTKGLRLGGAPCFGLINEKSWQSLTADEQKALMQAGAEAGKKEGELWDAARETNLKMFEDEGIVVYEPTPEEMEIWNAPLAGSKEIWLEEMGKQGLAADRMEEIWATYVEVCEEVTK